MINCKIVQATGSNHLTVDVYLTDIFNYFWPVAKISATSTRVCRIKCSNIQFYKFKAIFTHETVDRYCYEQTENTPAADVKI